MTLILKVPNTTTLLILRGLEGPSETNLLPFGGFGSAMGVDSIVLSLAAGLSSLEAGEDVISDDLCHSDKEILHL